MPRPRKNAGWSLAKKTFLKKKKKRTPPPRASSDDDSDISTTTVKRPDYGGGPDSDEGPDARDACYL